MSGRRRLDWLGLTPEPERELPAAVAALRASLPHPPTGTAGGVGAGVSAGVGAGAGAATGAIATSAAAAGPDPAATAGTGAGSAATAGLAVLVAAERRRVERLVLRGGRHDWLRYLAEVTGLVTAVAAGTRPGERSGERSAALLAAEVVLDHHRMLIGLPGPGYGRTARDRTALEEAVRALRTTTRTGDPR
ncbi:hypothetical protein [Streptomyces sp. NPDC101132]|uniref:hypothetical protein n=1 Tax=Streptomyces sp. NPDC101132 TaxID=3366110 RepID=UPI00380BAEAF